MIDPGPRLLAVIRRPGALSAVVTRRNPRFPTDPAEAPCLVDAMAMTGLPEAICPWRDTDLKAWRSLQRVPDLNKRAALAIVRTLIASVSAPDAAVGELRPLDFSRGAVDLQPYLCSAAGEQLLLAAIAEPLIAASEHTELPEWHITHRQQITELPAEFRRTMLWGLHLSPWPRVEQTRAAFDTLGLATDAALRMAVARLLTLTDRDVGLAWLSALCDLPPDRRIAAACAALDTGVVQSMPDLAARRVR